MSVAIIFVATIRMNIAMQTSQRLAKPQSELKSSCKQPATRPWIIAALNLPIAKSRRAYQTLMHVLTFREPSLNRKYVN